MAQQRHKPLMERLHTDNTSTTWEYVAEVTPDGGLAPFRAAVTAISGAGEFARAPGVGDETRLRLRPGGRDVRIDHDALEEASNAKLPPVG